MLENSQVEFRLLFKRAQKLAELSDTVISVPRLAKRQTHRPAGPQTSAEEYFHDSLYVPLIKHFIADLKERFSEPVQRVLPLQGLVPTFLDNNTVEKLIDAARVYQNDLDY